MCMYKDLHTHPTKINVLLTDNAEDSQRSLISNCC